MGHAQHTAAALVAWATRSAHITSSSQQDADAFHTDAGMHTHNSSGCCGTHAQDRTPPTGNETRKEPTRTHGTPTLVQPEQHNHAQP